MRRKSIVFWSFRFDCIDGVLGDEVFVDSAKTEFTDSPFGDLVDVS